jgi:hypothetical protein
MFGFPELAAYALQASQLQEFAMSLSQFGDTPFLCVFWPIFSMTSTALEVGIFVGKSPL